MKKKKTTKKPVKAKKPVKKVKKVVKPKPQPVPVVQEPPEPQKPAEPLQPPRGMRDILPGDEIFWGAITEKAKALSQAFGYGRLETPILERKGLFVRGVGETSDIVQKEMYCFKDQGGDELCLRPEGTAPAARAYINHGMLNLPQPVKLWYLGPFFRRERPQAGRYRQFHQWSVEVLGDEHPVLDAEVISIVMTFFNDLKLPVTLEINSIGCDQCRDKYKDELVSFYEPKRELLCNACKVRLEANPLRILDCKEPQCELLREGAPQTTDFLCEPCRDHFMRVLEYLDETGVAYNLNPFIVRGLDYYTRTVFEIYPEEQKEPEEPEEEAKEEGEGEEKGVEEEKADLDNQENEEEDQKEKARGAQSALVGGGRYDGFVEQLGGRPTPGLGFALGLERMVAVMRARKLRPEQSQAPRIFIAQLGEAARRKTLSLWHNLRKDIPVAAALSKDGLKAQLEIANRLQVRYTIIIGQKEVLDQTAIIRDMEAGIQEVVDYNKLVDEVKKKLKED